MGRESRLGRKWSQGEGSGLGDGVVHPRWSSRDDHVATTANKRTWHTRSVRSWGLKTHLKFGQLRRGSIHTMEDEFQRELRSETED